MNYEKYADKALEKYGVTYKQVIDSSVDGVLKFEENKKTRKVFWSDHYVFTEEEYVGWKKWCLKTLSEEQFNWIDLCVGLGQPYLFEKEVVENDAEY